MFLGASLALVASAFLAVLLGAFGQAGLVAMGLQRLGRFIHRQGAIFAQAQHTHIDLAQAGEFGFLIVSFARSEGALPLAAGQMALLVISLSMLLIAMASIVFVAEQGSHATQVFVEAPVAGREGFEHEALEEPGHVREMPLGRADVGHRLHDRVLGRERLDERKAQRADARKPRRQ